MDALLILCSLIGLHVAALVLASDRKEPRQDGRWWDRPIDVGPYWGPSTPRQGPVVLSWILTLFGPILLVFLATLLRR